MSTLVIEHLKVSELPPQWATRLRAGPGQRVTVRIETEAEPDAGAETAGVDDPAFGIWHDRQDLADVEAFSRKLRSGRNPV